MVPACLVHFTRPAIVRGVEYLVAFFRSNLLFLCSVDLCLLNLYAFRMLLVVTLEAAL